MLSEPLRRIATAQLERGRAIARVDPPELCALVARAQTPSEVRRAMLKEIPLLQAREKLEAHEPSPHSLREEAAAVGLLDATPRDLEYRRLFPTLDLGIYCAHHAIGKPSEVLGRALSEHNSHLFHHGIGAFEAGWGEVRDAFRDRVAKLVGGDLLRGDVAKFENWSDSLAAILGSGVEGRLLGGADHFTSGRYIHRWWAEQTGGTFVELEGDRDEWVPTQAYIEALTPDTTAVSISAAHWRTARLHDMAALVEAMDAVCPDAMLIVDAYQVLGLVPFRIDNFPMRTAITGAGVKQLHAGTGSGFAWMSHALMADLDPNRIGWFAHADPLDFAPPPFEPAFAAGRWQTGVPDFTPMRAFITEVDVLSTLVDGTLSTAIERVRARTVRILDAAIERARSLDFEVVGEGRAAVRSPVLAIRMDHGEKLVESMGRLGIIGDFRPDGPGERTGILRLSTAGNAFGYELLFTLEAAAEIRRGM
jgi:kynureninase